MALTNQSNRAYFSQENGNEKKSSNEGIGFGRDDFVVSLTRQQSLYAELDHELTGSGRSISTNVAIIDAVRGADLVSRCEVRDMGSLGTAVHGRGRGLVRSKALFRRG